MDSIGSQSTDVTDIDAEAAEEQSREDDEDDQADIELLSPSSGVSQDDVSVCSTIACQLECCVGAFHSQLPSHSQN